MDREKQIAILMTDYCTRAEAEKHIDRGTVIYEHPWEWIDSLKESEIYEGETLEGVRNRLYKDVSMTIYEGKEYLIMYVL